MTGPRWRRHLGALSALIALLVVVGLGVAPAPQNDSNLAVFDAAWSIINDSHWDLEFNGVDWPAVREELRPRAAAAASDDELREVIGEMIGRLGQSHFAIWPADAIEADGEVARGMARPGFDFLLIDEEFVVSGVDPQGLAAAAGVLPGWVIAAIDGEAVEFSELVGDDGPGGMYRLVEAQRRVQRRLMGIAGDRIDVTFVDGDDRPRELQLGLAAPQGQIVTFGNLPPLLAHLDDRIVEPDVGFQVGVIGFNIWMPQLARSFDAALDTMREADGIVVDLRGNPGGLGGMVMGVGGHFVNEVTPLGTMRTRGTTLDFVTNPRRVDTEGNLVTPFAGALAILIDGTSASTSEVFAAGLQAIGRARVFGQTSMGAVLPSLMEALPNGDILQHAVADFIVTANGVRLEGQGVVPDEPIVVTRADLLAGRDPILEAALEWIAGRQ